MKVARRRGPVATLFVALVALACAPSSPHGRGGDAVGVQASALEEDPLQWTFDDVLLADGFAGNRVGADVALEGDLALIGAPGDGDHSVQSGAAYVYVPNGSEWSIEQKLIPPDGVDADSFGVSVALSGNTAIIGAYRETLDFASAQGAVYVFVRSGTSWALEQKLTAPGAADGGFGRAVAIEGDQIIVGAPTDQPNGVKSGAAYAYSRTGGTWTKTQDLVPGTPTSGAQFGVDLALSAGRVVVGEPGAAGGGSAEVFRLSAGAWGLEQELRPPTNDGVHFGQFVALEGDRALVSDPDIRTSIWKTIYGRTYLFERDGATWPSLAVFQPPIEDGHVGVGLALAGDHAYMGYAGFHGGLGVFAWSNGNGTSVVFSSCCADLSAVAASGSRVLAGAGGANIGFAQIVDTSQNVSFTFAPTDEVYFGSSAAVDDGAAFVTADYNTIYAFAKTPDWAQVARLAPTTARALHDTLALTADAALVGVRETYDQLGSAIFYSRSGPQLSSPQVFAAKRSGDRFGETVALRGDRAAIGAIDPPCVYVLERTGSVWAETQTLDARFAQYFGTSLALSADTLVVANRNESGAGGAVYVYTYGTGGFAFSQTLAPEESTEHDFGLSVAFAKDSLLVSSNYGLRVYERRAGTWVPVQLLAGYGTVMAADDFALVVGVETSGPISGPLMTIPGTLAVHRDEHGWSPWQLLPYSALAVSNDRALFRLPDLHGRDRVGVYELMRRPVVCGDGEIGPGEQCDDSNTASGDGCASTCQSEMTGAGGTGGTGGTTGNGGTAGVGEAGTSGGGLQGDDDGGGAGTPAEIGGTSGHGGGGRGGSGSPTSGGTQSGEAGETSSGAHPARGGSGGSGADATGGADSGGSGARGGSRSSGGAGGISGAGGTPLPPPEPTKDTGCDCTVPPHHNAPPSSGPFGALALALVSVWRIRRRKVTAV